MNKIGRPATGKFFNCILCSKEYYRHPSSIKKGEIKFCSKACDYIFKRGKTKTIKPIEARDWRVNRKGYLQTTIRRIRILQHRWVMEKNLDRSLLKTEFVHHINGNKLDNVIDNLVLVSSKLHTHEHQAVIRELKITKGLLHLIVNNKSKISSNWLKNVKRFLRA